MRGLKPRSQTTGTFIETWRTREALEEESVSVDLTQTKIDPNEPKYQPLLEDLQGNILKSHERDYSAHIFVKFKPDADAARKWISDFAKEFVTSAKKQLDKSASQKSEALFANFFLSYRGYEALGFKLEAGGSGEFPSPAFKVGMGQFQQVLKDPHRSEWEEGFQE